MNHIQTSREITSPTNELPLTFIEDEKDLDSVQPLDIIQARNAQVVDNLYLEILANIN